MCLSTTGFGSRTANQQAHLHNNMYHSGTRSPTLDEDYSPQPDFSESSRPSPDFGMGLQRPYPGNPQDRSPFGGNMDPSLDTAQPTFNSTSSSQTPQYQSQTNVHPQQREYYSNPARTPPPSLYTTTPLTASNVPDNLYDFTSNDFDFLAMNDESLSAVYQGNSGLHLGYDAEHDWSEGVQTELFGDFFFGGAGNEVNGAQ